MHLPMHLHASKILCLAINVYVLAGCSHHMVFASATCFVRPSQAYRGCMHLTSVRTAYIGIVGSMKRYHKLATTVNQPHFRFFCMHIAGWSSMAVPHTWTYVPWRSESIDYGAKFCTTPRQISILIISTWPAWCFCRHGANGAGILSYVHDISLHKCQRSHHLKGVHEAC